MNRWQPKKRIELDYLKALEMIMERYFITPLMKDKTTPDDIFQRLREGFVNDRFEESARRAAAYMVTGIAAESAKTWRRAASEGMKSSSIRSALMRELRGPVGQRMRDIITTNAELIRSVPGDIAQDLTAFIAAEAGRGRRSEEVSQEIPYHLYTTQIRERFEHLKKTHIALIARTEASKASTALTRSRSEELGLDWYLWRTSSDARVREAHRIMSLVLVSWSDAPAPEALAKIRSSLGHYHAGDCPNCRCYPEPVLNLNRLKWPMKVYRGGQIKRMNRHQFEDMIGMRKAA